MEDNFLKGFEAYSYMAYKKGLETKELILEGSKQIFLQYGFEKSTFKQIGDYLKINQNLITYHFKNKKTLGKAILSGLFAAEHRFVAHEFSLSYTDAPMLYYMVLNRLHYQVLASNPDIFHLYTELIEAGCLHNGFSDITYTPEMYNAFFSYYQLEKKYPVEYYFCIEFGCEQGYISIFSPDMAEDESFIAFITSIFPKVIGLPDHLLQEALAESKKICLDMDVRNFRF